MWGWLTLFASGCIPESPLVELESSEGTIAQGDCVDETCACPIAYPDEDGDGFGDPERGRHVCTELPPGMLLVGGDCYDGNADAHPQALIYHAVDRGDGSFDYDCDGVELVEHAREAKCQPHPLCDPAPIDGYGWVGSLPNCGEEGDWMIDCDRRLGWTECRPEVERGRLAPCR